MNFKSVADMQRDIVSNLHRLPSDVDLVIGIPRSGMLAASLVALNLHLPLADIDGFAEGRILSAGKTRRRAALEVRIDGFKHAIVIDDTFRTGNAMRAARNKLAESSFGTKFTFAAVYGVAGRFPEVDLTIEVVHSPRIFEWNLMHHSILANSCVDIDGVLCYDPNEAENDDGPAYLDFLLNARPRHTPTHEIGTLVTSRLEKYRAETENWLKARGICYRELAMLDLPDAETRRRLGAHASFKAERYKSSSAILFIESELRQATKIAELSGKPVLWSGGPEMCYPSMLSPIAIRQKFQASTARILLQRLIGDARYDQLKTLVRSRAGGR